MASVTAVSANPTTVNAHGGTSIITPTISDPSSTATITVSVDGTSVPLNLTIGELLTYSVNPADESKPGFVVATVSPTSAGTLASNGDGTFTFTAA